MVATLFLCVIDCAAVVGRGYRILFVVVGADEVANGWCPVVYPRGNIANGSAGIE